MKRYEVSKENIFEKKLRLNLIQYDSLIVLNGLLGLFHVISVGYNIEHINVGELN